MASPVGLEYREIEIAVGEPWTGGGGVCKTHGWPFSAKGNDKLFAVAWNGLVYPVLRVGETADLRKDWSADDIKPERQGWSGMIATEELSVGYAYPSTVTAALLLRMGEKQLANAIIAQLVGSNGPTKTIDYYRSLAGDWTWFAFERAVCAHERGDDRLALANARRLTASLDLIVAEVRRCDLKATDGLSNLRTPDQYLAPFLTPLAQLPQLLADSDRRLTHRANSGIPKNNIAVLIEDLENAQGQPSSAFLADDERVQALVKRGAEAVGPLLDAMENDERLTRAVSFGREYTRNRDLISVAAAAQIALENVLRTSFEQSSRNGGVMSTKRLARKIRGYWGKRESLTEEELFYAMLKDDQAKSDQWMQAAASIVEPVDFERHGRWTPMPARITSESARPRGESLRDGRTPSVSDLLARRSDDIAAIRTGSTEDHFLYSDAGTMALHLAAWDKKAAIPVLTRRLARAWSIGEEPRDILAINGNPAERFGSVIARMTMARADCGDPKAYDEYAIWIEKADLKNIFFPARELQKPLTKGAARPSIGLAIEYLFNDPRSPWSDVLASGNGSWQATIWQTTLVRAPGFRKQALRALAKKTPAGFIQFNPPEEWQSRMEAQIEFGGHSMGYRGSNGDPETPPPGEKRPFRVCDAFAFFYAQNQKGPPIELFWPETKRDESVEACRRWLETAE